MSTSVRLATAVEAVTVTIDIDGQPVRAFVTREALEALYKAPPPKSRRPLLDAFRDQQPAIEAAIVAGYARDRKEPVVIHVNG